MSFGAPGARLKRYDSGAAESRKQIQDFVEQRQAAETRRRSKLKAYREREAEQAARRRIGVGGPHDPISTRGFHYTNPERDTYRRMVYHAAEELSLRHALAPRRDRSTGKVRNWWAKPLALMLVALGIGFVLVVGLNETALLMQKMAAKF